ncbi:MAG: DUF4386 domain-containing protein [Chitinophagaceae bacterium]|jgi:hypothetical protein|nr:DUF4386 domain-containing protein [Chitinophagaceae bacterium]
MEPTKTTARVAGVFYLMVVLTGIYSLGYVPSKLFILSDAQKTYSNLVEFESIFRLGIVAEVICYISFLILPIVLFRLLNHVNKNYAIAMVALSVVSVPFSLFNLMYKLNILTLIKNSDKLNLALDAAQTQVMLQLNFYNNGIQLVSIFWGLWLFPFGYLVYKSGFLPKVLGLFLMAGCFGYLIKFIGGFLLYAHQLTFLKYVTLPATIGEIGICFWLLIVGIRSVNK